jgi:RIO-like serine/threonine protein kinase
MIFHCFPNFGVGAFRFIHNPKVAGMTQHLSWCAVTVSRAPFELMQLQQFASGVKVTSVRAGYRQVIEVFGDCSREPL